MTLRRTLPLLLTGTMGVGLLGFGLTGLSSAEPQLRTAHETVERERQQQTSPLMQRVNCDPDEKPAPASTTPEV